MLPGEFFSVKKEHPSVLVVDDDLSFLEFVSHILRLSSVNVRVTSDPMEALDLIDATTYDAVLLDIKMPGMNGLEMLEYIRPRNPKLALMILSANLDEEMSITVRSMGCDDFLEKPCSPAALKRRLVSLIHRRDLH